MGSSEVILESLRSYQSPFRFKCFTGNCGSSEANSHLFMVHVHSCFNVFRNDMSDILKVGEPWQPGPLRGLSFRTAFFFTNGLTICFSFLIANMRKFAVLTDKILEWNRLPHYGWWHSFITSLIVPSSPLILYSKQDKGKIINKQGTQSTDLLGLTLHKVPTYPYLLY